MSLDSLSDYLLARFWKFLSVISDALFCALDRESEGVGQPRDEARVNRGSCFGVVFANRVGVVRHEEGVAQHRESDGCAQPRDEARANRGSRGGVVFANRVVALSVSKQRVRYEKREVGIKELVPSVERRDRSRRVASSLRSIRHRIQSCFLPHPCCASTQRATKEAGAILLPSYQH